VLAVVLEELAEIREKYGDPRRTEITGAVEVIETEDLIVEEDMIVTVSHLGYVKRNAPVTEYRAQRRGGKGLKGMETRDEDFVDTLFSCRPRTL
jgi:DNA gyrase subunit A